MLTEAFRILLEKTNKKALLLIATYKSGAVDDYMNQKEKIYKIMGNYKEHINIKTGVFQTKELYALSDIVVIPQTSIGGATGYPVTLIEAMTSRKAIIASRIEGIKEIIINKKTGILFKNKNCRSLYKQIVLALEKPQIRKKIALNAQKFETENFCIKKIAKKYSDVYKNS